MLKKIRNHSTNEHTKSLRQTLGGRSDFQCARTVCALSLISVFIATPASAQSTVLAEICHTMMVLVQYLRYFAYLLYAIALVMIGVSAMTTGRFNFGHLITITFGLFIVHFVPSLIAYITSGDAYLTCPRLEGVTPIKLQEDLPK